MSDVALPKIKVSDAENLDGGAAGTSGVDSPSGTDGGQSVRPLSATSSEGTFLDLYAKDASVSKCCYRFMEVDPTIFFYFRPLRLC